MLNCGVGVLIRQSPVKLFHVREHTGQDCNCMSTTTGYDPLLLRAQDVAVVCPKARNINKFLTKNRRSRKIAMSVSEELANAVCHKASPRNVSRGVLWLSLKFSSL